MATRYYLTQHHQGVIEGEAQGPWGGCGISASTWGPIQMTFQMSLSKTAGGMRNDKTSASNLTPNADLLIWRFITPALAAQTISGTFDWMNYLFQSRFDPVLVAQGDAVVAVKVYVYATIGESNAVRGELLDFVDLAGTGAFPKPGGNVKRWQLLTAPQTMTSQVIQAGDRIMVEIGFRVVSMPIASPPTYPPSTWTGVEMRINGCTATTTPFAALADAVALDVSADRAGFFEFSGTITELAPAPFPGPVPTTGRTCLTAQTIASVPFNSGAIDTTGADDAGFWGAGNAYWFTFTNTGTGAYYHFMTRGSNYPVQVSVMGRPPGQTCASAQLTLGMGFKTAGAHAQSRREIHYNNRSGSSSSAWIDAGLTVWIVCENMPTNSKVGNSVVPDATAVARGANGGTLVLEAWRQDPAPMQNDLYALVGDLEVLREDPATREVTLINLAANLITGINPTGIAIDYTNTRPHLSFGTESRDEVDGPATHTGYRVLINSFDFDFVEVFPIDTLSWTPNTAEVDFVETQEDVRVGIPGYVGGSVHGSALHATPEGIIYSGAWANGFALVCGFGTNLPAFLDHAPQDDLAGTTYFRDVADGAGNRGFAGLAATGLTAPIPAFDKTTCSYITIDDATGIMYYTSGGWYAPFANPDDVTSVTDVVKRFDITGNVQLADWGPFAVFGSAAAALAGTPPNAGLRGLQFVPRTGGLLVVNSDRVMLLDIAGNIVRFYIPLGPQNHHNDLIDVVMDADQTEFWVMDGQTTTLFKFDIDTGVQVNTYQMKLIPGTHTQMAIFLPGGFELPPAAPGPPEPCPQVDGNSFVTPVP